MASFDDEVRSAILSYADMSWTLDEAYGSIMEEIAAALDGLGDWCPWCCEPCGHHDETIDEVRRVLLGPSGENGTGTP